MAQVPYQGFQTVPIEGIPARSHDLFEIRPPPDAFGAATSRALEQLGGQGEKATGELFKSAVARQGLLNEIAANDANTSAIGQIAQRFGQFSQLRGQAAQLGLDTYKNDVQNIYRQAVDNAPSLQMKAQLSNSIRTMADRYMLMAQNHADTQLTAYNKQSANDGAAVQFGLAGNFIGDQKQMDEHLQAGLAQLRKGLESDGLSYEQQNAELLRVRGRQAVELVKLASAQDNAPRGREIYNVYKDSMDLQSQQEAETTLRAAESRKKSNGSLALAYAFLGIPGAAPPPRSAATVPGLAPTQQAPNPSQTGATPQMPGRASVTATPELAQAIEHAGEHGHTGDVSPAGALGVMQVEPGTAKDVSKAIGVPLDLDRLKNDDNYNRQFGTAYLNQMLRRYDGNQVLAVAAYNAGPARVDDWIKRFGDPRTGAISDVDFTAKIPLDETRGYVGRVSQAMHTATAPPQPQPGQLPSQVLSGKLPVSEEQAIRNVLDAGLDEETEGQVLSDVHRIFTLHNELTATERTQLTQQFNDSIAYMESGHGDAQLPWDRIGAVFSEKPEELALMHERYILAQQVGKFSQDLRLQPTSQLEQQLSELTNDKGAASDSLRRITKAMIGPNGAMVGGAEDPTYFRLREGFTNQIRAAIQQRNEALFGNPATGKGGDPAAYVASNPSVKDAYNAIQNNPNTAAWEKYAAATIATQSYLGVPGPMQHVLTEGMALDMAQKLTSSGDTWGTLQKWQQAYGKAFQPILSDLSSLGKLPVGFAMVGALPNPADAADLSRYMADEQKGLKPQDRGVPPQAMAGNKSVANVVRLDPRVNALRMSMQASDASGAFIANMEQAVEKLAYSRMIYRGEDQAAATEHAVSAFTDQYSFNLRGARVQKSNAVNVISQAHAQAWNIDINDLDNPKDDNGQTMYGGKYQPPMQDYLNRIRANPMWATTQDESAVVLMDPGGFHGQPAIVRHKDGTPYSIPMNVGPTPFNELMAQPSSYMGGGMPF